MRPSGGVVVSRHIIARGYGDQSRRRLTAAGVAHYSLLVSTGDRGCRMRGLGKTAGILLGLALLALGILMVLGVLDFLLRIAGVLCILAAVVMLGMAFFGSRRGY